MNDLDRRIREWCATIVPEECGGADKRHELEDHLATEIAHLEATGLTPEQAFNTATRRLGDVTMLLNEYAKDRSFVSRLCALDRKLSGTAGPSDPALRRIANRLLVGNALLWAAAMLAGALLLQDADASQSMLLFVLIPLWFASQMLITAAFRSLTRRLQH